MNFKVGKCYLVQHNNSAGIPSGQYYELRIVQLSPSKMAMKVRYADSRKTHWVDVDDFSIKEELPVRKRKNEN